MDIHLLKIKAKALSPLVRIGKAGLNEYVIEEIKKQLLLHKLVKIKLLKSSIHGEKREFVDELLTQTNSQLILLQGNMVTIYKENGKK
ncbi:YhbY family RNA-binding protein [Candidatus Woesearchaeota archaeon]|nr:YhbY family RNA-binding protein [Candidatus Woesearchaeota archaeon]